MEERYRDGSAGTSELVIGDVEPGQKASGMLRLPGGEFWVPATVIRGRSGEKTVLITAGIHAGEYVGIQAAVELAREIPAESVPGRIILI